MSATTFEELLTGGHPNSLGNTVQVVQEVLLDKRRLQELYDCYFSTDEVVRLRVSNAMKRICKQHPEWLVPYVDRLVNEIAAIDQASTKWTLATLFLWLQSRMSQQQKTAAVAVMKSNLETSKDWIVLNTTLESLYEYSKNDAKLLQWLIPKIELLKKDPHGSVARRAAKYSALAKNLL